MSLENEPEIKKELDELLRLLAEHETVQAFQEIQERAMKNERLKNLEEQIKAAQKDAVNFAHYGKPEAEKQAVAKIQSLTKTFDEDPIVLAYRQALLEADELLQYMTTTFQRQVNQAIEEESK